MDPNLLITFNVIVFLKKIIHTHLMDGFIAITIQYFHVQLKSLLMAVFFHQSTNLITVKQLFHVIKVLLFLCQGVTLSHSFTILVFISMHFAPPNCSLTFYVANNSVSQWILFYCYWGFFFSIKYDINLTWPKTKTVLLAYTSSLISTEALIRCKTSYHKTTSERLDIAFKII